ncbi:glycosyltransferase family 4 protein [Euzebya tangerina]|uniref:glycosyltransferase family 4 protein n=1 Tax=Euzebya tangerina TaxID=591198 RepID=UPI000E310D34|nr:glycosyltransferase family 4 protein [Euzebya tangerina]
MKILVAARGNYPLVRHRATAMAKMGHEVIVATMHPDTSPPSEYEQVCLPSAGAGGLTYLGAAWRLRQLFRRLDPDLVDAHGATSYGFASALVTVDAPMLLTLYGSDLYAHARGSAVLTQLARIALRRADVVYGSTADIQPLAESVAKRSLHGRFISLPWGVPVYDDVLRSAPGSGGEETVIIHPRRVDPHWRISHLIHAVALAQEAGDARFRLDLIYPAPTSEERDHLSALLREAETADVNVRDVGPLDHATLCERMRTSDVFASAAREDMLSNSLLEGMLYGCIPIVSDLAAYRSAQDRWDVRYWPADPDDAPAWSRHLATAHRMATAERAELAAHNAKAVSSNSGVSEMTAQLLDRVTSAISRP